jgi:cobalamin biosynthesis protein CbiD
MVGLWDEAAAFSVTTGACAAGAVLLTVAAFISKNIVAKFTHTH